MISEGLKLDDFIVQPTDTIRTAMKKIERNKHRVVIVVQDGYVLGTVSDGDVRRAFLYDVLSIAAVSTVMNMNCRKTTVQDPEKGQELLHREKVTVLPIVDEENRLIGIHTAYEPFFDSN